MTTIADQISSTDAVICKNIANGATDRGFLSQNILSQLRNLVEGVLVHLHLNDDTQIFSYDSVDPALKFISGKAHLNFVCRFHGLLQKSASHYTLGEDPSVRLMLKYYEYLVRLRKLVRDKLQRNILANLEEFPVHLDPSLREYHEKIATKVEFVRSHSFKSDLEDRFYIHKTRPFFANGDIFYEVTFYRAVNKASKFDRLIAFTSIEIEDNYAANLRLVNDSIEILGKTMPIIVINDWHVSIRPCEINNFARLLGLEIQTTTKFADYRLLMDYLTNRRANLLDVLDASEERYTRIRAHCTNNGSEVRVFSVLEKARNLIQSKAAGANIIRYLLLRMNNKILKQLYDIQGCNMLPSLKLGFSCIPFEQMPFCTSPPRHNPRFWDLVDSLDVEGRAHELLARRVRNNVERNGRLYTALTEFPNGTNFAVLIEQYNSKLYWKHKEHRQLVLDKGHVFIQGYENTTVEILAILQRLAAAPIAGYSQAVRRWVDGSQQQFDDPTKQSALIALFSQAQVALIYGAAGTGKSTMVDYIARYFNDSQKLFLAHTNPAIDNLKRRVKAQNSDFRTIRSHVSRNSPGDSFDLLVIDECSTVSNADLLKVLTKTNFRALVLVGDIYQIESIEFGNWFSIVRSFIPATSVFELKTPFRTKNTALLDFWGKVRELSDDIAESMVKNSFTNVLDESLFEPKKVDEIVLCLNYDGLYGINNVNRFLQSSNPNQPVLWLDSVYKVGDPILFHEAERFRPVIYNNLKGAIVGIEATRGKIQFDIALDRPLSAFDVTGPELTWIKDSTVRFTVFQSQGTSDEDDDALNIIVPFQIAYAVSIHKAQGLEYDSVKIVITDANQDDISHSIFYTAITRARDQLKIFWTPETQQRVLTQIRRDNSQKDVHLLAARRGLTPI
jgi:AAA domain/UvrD-like helicase C-terminal domain